MPIVTIDMFEGRTLEQKRALAKGVTTAVCEALGVAADAVQIKMVDMKRENLAKAGVLFSDK